MCDRKDIWQRRYYAVPRIYMILIGIWPYQAIRDRYLLFALLFAFSLTILGPQLMYLLVVAANLDDVFSCTPSIWISIIFSFKIANLMNNEKVGNYCLWIFSDAVKGSGSCNSCKDKLKTCLKMIEDDWSTLNTDMEKTILQRHAVYGQYITTSYAVFMQLTAVLLILKSAVTLLFEDTSDTTVAVIAAESKLPYRVEYGEKLNRCLCPVAIHCYLAVFAHISITIAVDSLYITLVQHACGMFEIVGHTLEHIGKDNDDSFDLKPDRMTDGDYEKALSCLRRHLHVIEFAELIEAAFTNIFLVSVCLNMIGGSMIGIQVALNLADEKDIVEPLTIYIAQLFHLFVQFWQGQFLLTYSAVPYESIGNWYYTSSRCRKILLLIMNRTMLPCKLTVGKIVTLSIETFGVVLKTSMSYFTMLRSFK